MTRSMRTVICQKADTDSYRIVGWADQDYIEVVRVIRKRSRTTEKREIVVRSQWEESCWIRAIDAEVQKLALVGYGVYHDSLTPEQRREWAAVVKVPEWDAVNLNCQF